MNDSSQDSWLRKRGLQERLVALMDSYGYHLLETPVLESTELFLRKSGGELASRMYSFTDAGSNSVSLRPEFTAPIMRHYLEHAEAVDVPAPLAILRSGVPLRGRWGRQRSVHPGRG